VVSGIAEALAAPVVSERGIVQRASQPGIADPIAVLGPPVLLSATPADALRRPAPRLGEHTREILRESGMAADEIDALLRDGVLR
jgi:crotonobetainyl-CoA:carnitine CoA-transferase CaiB-like acyl-CoA transferase